MSRPVSKLSASSGMPKATKKPTTNKSKSHQGISSGALARGHTQLNVHTAKGGNIIVSGSEYLGAIQKPGVEAPDYLYVSRPNIAGPTNTRLQQFATIYERWRPLKYRYRFTSSLPTSCTGTFCMASEPDPVIPYAQGEAGNVARLRALPGSKMFQAWESAYADIPSSRDYTSLWCEDPDTKTEGSDRLDQAGTFYLACAATTSVASGTTIGMLELEYSIEFFVPRLNSSALGHEASFGFDTVFWDAIMSSSIASGVVNKIMLYLKTYAGPVSSVLSSVLRLYETTAATSLVSDPGLGGHWGGGFSAGFHSYRMTLCYSAGPLISPDEGTPGAWTEHNTVHSEGPTFSTHGWNAKSNYRANNGVTYAEAYGIAVDFVVSGAMRGWFDFSVKTSDFAAPDYVEFVYAQKGSETFTTLNADGTGTRVSKKAQAARVAIAEAVKKVKRDEGKGESKAPAKVALDVPTFPEAPKHVHEPRSRSGSIDNGYEMLRVHADPAPPPTPAVTPALQTSRSVVATAATSAGPAPPPTPVRGGSLTSPRR